KKKSGLPKTQVAPSSNTVIKKQLRSRNQWVVKRQLDRLFGGIVALCFIHKSQCHQNKVLLLPISYF
ncbi:TPA: hypothetical protein ACPDT7_002042, partial [Pasteurella multocida]